MSAVDVDAEAAADVESEAAVLGAAMLNAPDALDGLTVDDFTEPRHRDVFTALATLTTLGAPTDPVTVLGQLRRTGTLPTTADRGPGNWLHDLTVAAPTRSAAAHYRQAVVEAAVRRRVAQAFERVAQAAETDSLESFAAVVKTEMAAVSTCGVRLSGTGAVTP